MKKILLGLLAVLAGQFAVLKKKDKAFNTQLKKKEGLDKLQFVWDKLMSFNKELFDESKDHLKTINIEEEINKTKAFVSAEYKNLKEQMTELQGTVKDLGEEKAMSTVKELKSRLDHLKKTSKSVEEQLDEQYGLKGKMKELTTLLTKVKNAVKEFKNNVS